MIPRRTAFALAAAGCLALLAGCESGSGTVRPAPGVEVVSDADAAGVAVLADEPQRPYAVVGRVRAMADARFEARIDEARAAAERALRRQGASVGADAVIVDEALIMDLDGGAIEPSLGGDGFGSDHNLQRPGGAAYATRPVHRVVLTGRAVRFAD
jgi:hypothetical protein